MTALVLVWAGVAVALACCAGFLAMETAADKLHFAGYASTAAPPLVAAGVVVHAGFGAVGLTAILLVVALLAGGVASTIAVARVIRLHESGRVEATPEEAET